MARSGDHEPGANGTPPPVGSTVAGAEFTNTAALGRFWVDLELNSG
jgi:hypothetical protein